MFKWLSGVIAKEEGFRPQGYLDSLGKCTIGHGIHYITEDESLAVVEMKLEKIYEDMLSIFGDISWVLIDDVRQAALISMHYQLGSTGFRSFKRLIGAVRRRDWETAADEALASVAAEQTPSRYVRISNALRTGVDQWTA